MRQTSIILFFIIINFNLSAQVPGYQGKRLSVEYNNLFFNALINPNPSREYYPNFKFTENIITFNSRNNVSFDYVLDRKNSLGFGFEFFRTRFTFRDDFEISLTQDYGSGIHYRQSSSSSELPIGEIFARSLNLHYTVFTKNTIAPLGRYLQYEFGIIQYEVEYDKDKLHEDVSKYYDNNTIVKLPEFKNWNWFISDITD